MGNIKYIGWYKLTVDKEQYIYTALKYLPPLFFPPS